MELLTAVLIKILKTEDIVIEFPGLETDIGRLAEAECFRALEKIKAVIVDDSLEDSDCFMKIEGILGGFEELGVTGGNRHDFG